MNAIYLTYTSCRLHACTYAALKNSKGHFDAKMKVQILTAPVIRVPGYPPVNYIPDPGTYIPVYSQAYTLHVLVNKNNKNGFDFEETIASAMHFFQIIGPFLLNAIQLESPPFRV